MTNFNTTQTSELVNIIKNYNIPDLGTLISAYSELRVREHNFDYETIRKLEEIAQLNGEVSFNNLFIDFDFNKTNETSSDPAKTISPENLELKDSENEKAKINSITTIPSNKVGKPNSNQTKKQLDPNVIFLIVTIVTGVTIFFGYKYVNNIKLDSSYSEVENFESSEVISPESQLLYNSDDSAATVIDNSSEIEMDTSPYTSKFTKPSKKNKKGVFDFIKYHEGEDGEPFFKGKPNFSRYFEIVYAGAGSGVGSYVMLDTRDGKVYDVTDLETSCDGYGNLSNGNNEFNLFSNIFEIENCDGGFGGTPKLFRYEWNDNLKKFVLINNTQSIDNKSSKEKSWDVFLVEFKNAAKNKNREKLISMTVEVSDFNIGGGGSPRDFFMSNYDNPEIYSFNQSLKGNYVDHRFPSGKSYRIVGGGKVEGGDLIFRYRNEIWLFGGVVGY